MLFVEWTLSLIGCSSFIFKHFQRHSTKFYSHEKKNVGVCGAKPAVFEVGGRWSRKERQLLTNTGLYCYWEKLPFLATTTTQRTELGSGTVSHFVLSWSFDVIPNLSREQIFCRPGRSARQETTSSVPLQGQSALTSTRLPGCASPKVALYF